MKSLKISDLTYQAIITYRNFLYEKQGKKWTFDDLINIAICNDYVHALNYYEKKVKKYEKI